MTEYNRLIADGNNKRVEDGRHTWEQPGHLKQQQIGKNAWKVRWQAGYDEPNQIQVLTHKHNVTRSTNKYLISANETARNVLSLKTGGKTSRDGVQQKYTQHPNNFC